MKIMMIIAGLCMALSGCVGFSWTSKIDDGAIYERNLKCLTPEKYDQAHILNSHGIRGGQ